MSEELDRDASVHLCSLCKQWQKIVKAVQTAEGTTLVGRCLTCDTHPCRKCQGRTMNPTATKCKHCGHPISLEARA